MNSLLDNLPDINFAEKDISIIEAEVITRFEEKIGRTLYPGDPRRQVLLGFVYYFALQRANIDFAGKQNLLRYAEEGFIENLAALVGTARLEPRPAVTVLEFTLSTNLPGVTVIPKGTRATPGGSIFFATTENAEIPAGSLRVTVPALCTREGIIGNNFLPGQINRLVDTFPFNSRVTNTTVTQGGADIEAIEPLRERIRIAPESYSSAGPRGAYVYWAKTANQLIIDVEAHSPSPGVVHVVPLLKNGELPDQGILNEVYDICSAEYKRPLTDFVIVSAPVPVEYSISFTYYIARRDSSVSLTLQQNVLNAVEEYITWQKSKPGRNIDPSMLIKLLRKVGVRPELRDINPGFRHLEYYQLGVVNRADININYGGLEDN